ncbi:MAG: HemK2/MTQ2 family protein methyltransferase [Nanoarchaeota archaeon]
MIYVPAEDSFLLAHEVRKNVEGKTFLDMGAGSGIQCEEALKAGASSVLAVDDDRVIVQLLKRKNIPALHSDLFEKIKERFDVIVFNPPYLPFDEREDKESRRITTGGKNGDELILRFLKEAPKHLNRKGMILLLLSSLTPKKIILKLLEKQKMRYEIVAKEKLFFEKLEVWKIVFEEHNL